MPTDEFQKERPQIQKEPSLSDARLETRLPLADDNRFQRPDQVANLMSLTALCLGVVSLILFSLVGDDDDAKSGGEFPGRPVPSGRNDMAMSAATGAGFDYLGLRYLGPFLPLQTSRRSVDSSVAYSGSL